MASRVCIAAAACAVASGLFIGSAGVTIAFADPDASNASQRGDSQVGAGLGNPAGAAPKGPQAGTASPSRPTGPSSAADAAVRPTSPTRETNGGATTGPTASAGATPSSSKQIEPSSTSLPQTLSTAPGELTAGVGTEDGETTGVETEGGETTGGETTQTTGGENPDTTTQTTTATETTETTTQTTTAVETTKPTTTTTTTKTPPPGPPDPNDPENPEQPGWGWGWPWWGPCPDHDPLPGGPPGSGGGGGGSPAQPPSGRPDLPPQMQLPFPGGVTPNLPGISVEPVVDAVTGLATAAAQLPFTPITLPVIVVPGGVGAGAGAGAGGAGPRPGNPSAPRNSGLARNSPGTPRAARENTPAFAANDGVSSPNFRAGYGEYLRAAGVGQVAAVAVPGVAGILFLTGAGGLLGYRQARAGHAVRANGTARFMG